MFLRMRRWRERLLGTARGTESILDAHERDEELQFHIDMATQRNVARGMRSDVAKREAHILFGSQDRIHEEIRDVQRARPLEDFMRDAAHAIRVLRTSPAFAFTAILTLALGIGANTAIFSVLDAVLLRPLPYEKPEQLVAFRPEVFASYQSAARNARTLSRMGAYTYSLANVSGGDEPVRVWSLAVTSSLLPTLGVTPMLGRNFDASDDAPGAPARVIMRYDFWRTHFGGDRAIVGRTVLLDGASYEVIGILPVTLEFPPPVRNADGSMPIAADVWTPMGRLDDLLERGGIQAIARLANGATTDRAATELTTIARADSPNAAPAVVQSVPESVVAPLRTGVLSFSAGVMLILMIACANLASLLLARCVSRNREFAIRTSIGATGSRVARQILTEGFVLAGIGALVGLGTAMVMLRALLRLAPPELVRVHNASLNTRVLLFTLLLTAVAALLVGLLPAWRAVRRSPGSVLTSMRGATQDGATGRMHSALVAMEVAFAVVLLVGGGLLLRSYAAINRVSPGFNPAHLVTADVLLPFDRYEERAVVLQFFDRLEASLSHMHGVDAVGAIDRLPYGQSWSKIPFAIAGRPNAPGHKRPTGVNTAVRPGYFGAMGIPLVNGRDFSPADKTDGAAVVIVGQALARRYWADASPIGARIKIFGVDREIIGVAGDVRHFGPLADVDPMIYLPQSQDAATRRMMTVVVRTSGEPRSMLPRLRSAIRSLDAALPISNLRTFDELRSERTAAQRFNALLMASFAALALTLVCVGIYGVMSFMVAQRTREIGVRMALGATQSSVLRDFIAHAMRAVAVGAIAGLLVAFPVVRLGQSLLFGVTTLDVPTYTGVIAFVGVVTLLSALAPALRAASTQPGVALGD